MSSTLFVGNLPYSLDEERLRELFEIAGAVVSARIMHDRETRRPRGFGFVEFENSAAAESAIRTLAGHRVDGRELIVNLARPRL